MSPPAAQSIAVRVAPRQPFDFGQSLRFLASFAPTHGEQRLQAAALTCAVREAGVVAAVRVRAEGTELVYELSPAGEAPPAAVAAIAGRVSFRLSVEDDLAPLYALAAGDPPFAAVVERLRGLHQVKLPSPLELMVWAILGQRAPLAVARRMKQSIVGAFTENRLVVEDETLWAFPDLDQLRTLTRETLTELIGNARKAGYLHAAFGHWAQLDEAFLRAGEYDAERERLLEIPGIGPWSASFLLIRGLGRMERMPADREARRAAAAAYGGGELSEAEFARLAGRYGDLRGYWGHYLRVAG